MDIITRPAYWNIAGREFLYLVLAIELAVLAYGLYRIYRRWRKVARIERFDVVARRLRQVAAQALVQRRLLRERTAGIAHLGLSWGFVLLFIGTLVAMLDEDFGIPLMRGMFYLWFQSLALDVAGLTAIAGLTVLLWRRYVAKAGRLWQPGW
jgi:nitrate reductase gamma subunit